MVGVEVLDGFLISAVPKEGSKLLSLGIHAN